MFGTNISSWDDVVDSAYYPNVGSIELPWLLISILLCLLALWWGHRHESRANADTSASSQPARAMSAPKSKASFVDAIVLIDGIGDKTAKSLKSAGISKLTQVVSMSDSALSDICKSAGAGDQWQTQEWKVQAQEMISGKPPRAKVDRDLVAKMLAKK